MAAYCKGTISIRPISIDNRGIVIIIDNDIALIELVVDENMWRVVVFGVPKSHCELPMGSEKLSRVHRRVVAHPSF